MTYYTNLSEDEKAKVDELADLMRGKVTTIVAGAGMSTDAGIPDYRGSGSSGNPTVDFDLFMSHPKWQRWVWQRNQETWRTVAGLTPTAGHLAVAALQRAGLVNGIATQNVDGLDERAGIQRPALLHGTFDLVDCTTCGAQYSREEVDGWMRRLNPDLKDDPDPKNVAILAQVDEDGANSSTFEPAPCPRCGGVLKPNVVFFGEQLPMQEMDLAFAYADAADVILVVGSSLMVATGLWVVHQGLQHGAKLAVINRGPTQVDYNADVRIEGGSSEILMALAERLGVDYSEYQG
ncbi:MAG: Sir2 family NAD-dependent protein deacetylase [Actinomycetaceae bacterium]|nr:Sir2 family NAD-dependent protein deacetylase [Actinomycetaceae bacterium]